MKFDSLYKIIVNEADAIEDVQELATDPIADEDLGEIAEQKPQTEDEMIDYLVQNSTIIGTGKGGRILTPTEKIKKAKDAIDNGFFDALYDGIQQKKLAQVPNEEPALEELPPDLEKATPSPDDLADVPALDEFERENKAREMEEDELSGQEI